VPTGIHIRDARKQLFDAAERLLLREGPIALTSRAVTTEAHCAKGVLHKHFTDFDAFLAEFVLDRLNQMTPEAEALQEKAGTNTIANNLTTALTAVFNSVAVAIVPLITFREELRTRLRDTWPAGVPVLTDAVALIEAYLSAEQGHGRIKIAADIQTLAVTLIGATHLLYADKNTPPTKAAVHKITTTILANATTNETTTPEPKTNETTTNETTLGQHQPHRGGLGGLGPPT
jgi:AcrR family transcriptional regulator